MVRKLVLAVPAQNTPQPTYSSSPGGLGIAQFSCTVRHAEINMETKVSDYSDSNYAQSVISILKRLILTHATLKAAENPENGVVPSATEDVLNRGLAAWRVGDDGILAAHS